MNDQKMVKQNSGALKIAGIYLLIGGLWILFSDEIAEAIAPDRNTLLMISTVKGWGYIIVTALLLYWLIQRHTILLQASDERRLQGIQRDVTERKRAEKALNESEERFRKTFRSVPVGLAITRASDGEYIDANDAFSEITGFSLEELTGQTSLALNITSPEQRRDYGYQINEKGFIHNQEMVLRNKSGESRIVLGSMEIIELNHETCVLSTAIDITERKRAEDALKDSQMQMAGIINSAMDAIISIDNSQHIVLFNPAAETMFGCERAFAIGQPIERFLPERFRASHSQHIKHFSETGITSRTMGMLGTIHGLRSNGEEFPIEASISQTRAADQELYTVILRDVTEHKRAERALDYQVQLLENVTDAIISTDMQFRILSWNKGAEAIYGWSEAEVLGRPLAEIAKPEYLTGQREEILQEFTAHGVWKGDVIHHHRDGSPIYFLASVSMLKDKSAKPSGAVSINHDITERKLIEMELRQSEERFSKAFQANPAAMVITRMSDGHVIDVNESYEIIHGYGREELLGKTKLNLDIFDHLAERQKIFEQLNEYGSVRSFETKLKTKSGEVRDVLFSLEIIEISAENCILAIFVDISERKQAEEALQKSQERFSKAFQANPAAMIITRMSDGHVIDVNESYEIIHGYGREELLGKTKLNLDIFDALAERQKIFEQLNEYGSIRSYETKLKDKSGEYRDVVTSLEIIEISGEACILATFVDITERKQAEEALLKSEYEFRLLAEAMPQIVWIIRPDGWNIYFNQQWVDYTGQTLEESYGNGWNKPFHPDDQQRAWDAWQDATKNGATYALDCRLRRADGVYQWWLIRGVPVLDKQGAILKWFGTCTDINQRKQAEDEIQRLNETLELRIIERTAQLESANKELEAFSYSVSHDLRSPLRGIDGWSLALLEDYGGLLDEQGQTHIQKVRAEAQRMGGLIDDILKLSRITRAEMNKENVDLSVIAETVAARLQETKPDDRQVEFVIQKRLTALGDPKLLEVVLTNLLENAFKFTSKKPEAHIEFGQTIIEGERAYFVRDNGAGFDMTYANKLFGAFQRMHRVSEFPGTGIGLATVQRIINRHGGSIWAASEVGEGSTFYFTLDDNDVNRPEG